MVEGATMKLPPKPRGYCAGEQMADAIIEFIHLMYQKRTARWVLEGLVRRIDRRKREFECKS